MTDHTLSPAAKAILTAQTKQRCLNEWDHVNDPPCHPSDDDWNGCYHCVDRRGLAAALRAAERQLGYELLGVRTIDCSQLLLIAEELEGNR